MKSGLFDVASFAFASHLAKTSTLGIGVNGWQASTEEGRWFFRYLNRYEELAGRIRGTAGLFTTDILAMRQFFVDHGYSSDPVHEPFDFGAAAFAKLIGKYGPGQAADYFAEGLPYVEIKSGFTGFLPNNIEPVIFVIDTVADDGVTNSLVVSHLADKDLLSFQGPLDYFAHAETLLNRIERSSHLQPESIAVPMFDLQATPDVSFLIGSETIDATLTRCVINQAYQNATLSHDTQGFVGKVISYMGGLREAMIAPRTHPFLIRPPFAGCILQTQNGQRLDLPLLPFVVGVDACHRPKPTE